MRKEFIFDARGKRKEKGSERKSKEEKGKGAK
jgi:hypothetical protein